MYGSHVAFCQQRLQMDAGLMDFASYGGGQWLYSNLLEVGEMLVSFLDSCFQKE